MTDVKYGVLLKQGATGEVFVRDTTNANGGSWAVVGGGGGGGAPTTAQYVTLATDATLTQERVLTAGTNISIVDGGAGSTVTVGVTGLATVATSGSASDLSAGTLPAARMPALTGDVTMTAGTTTTAIAANVVTNADLVQVATATIKGRTTAGTGNVEDLTTAQATALLDLFTSALKGLVPASGGGTTNFLRADGTWAAPPGGGGGSLNKGTTTVNFGAFPGSSHASVTVTGQAGIVAGSVVQAWIFPTATADHTADEHMLETIRVVAGDIVAGTGFTINAFNSSQLDEPTTAKQDSVSQQAARPGGRGKQYPASLDIGGDGTRIYGQWTVAWLWG